MIPDHPDKLAARVIKAAEAALADQNYASAIDVLLGIGWIDPGSVARWRRGQIDCLEGLIQTKPSRIRTAMKILEDWATRQGLLPTETAYIDRTPQRQTLRFTESGDPAIERFYRMHWVSPALSETARERLAEKTSRPPDLVVVQPLKTDWRCHRCGGTGGLLMVESSGPACLRCVGLDDLEYLPSGDALLTRRAKAKSTRHAVVVRFSRGRGRYERQGLLIEPQALAEARRELGRSA